MKTEKHSYDTPLVAGDDGEIVAENQGLKAEKSGLKPNEGLQEPDDTGWYVAVVRVNCEKNIALSIQRALNFHKVWFDYWIPIVKVPYIDKRSNKRKVKEKLFLSTFIFCRVSPRNLDEIRFRSDVYKMLTLPGDNRIYRISDKVISDYRRLIEVEMGNVTAAPVPLRKGIKVRIVGGSLAGLEAYVQSYNGKKAVIGNEIKYISGATIEVSRDLLEVVKGE